MNPWERRLADLGHLLESCARVYFEPDLFRLNVNQFLQTSRTVTFILQKNRSSIRDFEQWYAVTVEAPCRSDSVMTWAKDSRNKIEKQGDLEMHSTLRASLMFSYLREDDLALEMGTNEVLRAGVKRLTRLAQQRLPTGVLDAAFVKIERRWVARSLPSWELLHALNYVYGRLFSFCRDLAVRDGSALDARIPRPADFDPLRDYSRRVRYIKLRTRTEHRLGVELAATPSEGAVPLPPAFRTAVEEQRASGLALASLQSAVEYYARLAVNGCQEPRMFDDEVAGGLAIAAQV